MPIIKGTVTKQSIEIKQEKLAAMKNRHKQLSIAIPRIEEDIKTEEKRLAEGEMKCEQCGREDLSEKELSVHIEFFHTKQITSYEQPQRIASGACPECGATLWFQEGCASCHSCGYSKCG